MAEVQKTLRIASQISGIQIRYLGCKGMLVRDDTLPDNSMVIRDSMQKFEDKHCDDDMHTI